MTPASIAYLVFVGGAALLAVGERAVAIQHERRLRAAGAREIAPWVYSLMVPVYTLPFVAAPLEHFALGRRPSAGLAAGMVSLFVAAKALKLSVLRALGPCWTMRVFVPERPTIVSRGPYRYLRHPNYVAVIAEVVALPLVGGAFLTALVCGAAFTVLLVARVRSEEAALLSDPAYAAAMGARPRFLPAWRR